MFRWKSAVALAGLATAAMLAPASAVDIQTGRAYGFHTEAMGACQSADWYFYIDSDKSVEGYASWDRQRHRATLSGKINNDGTIQLQGHEMGGTRTAVIKGEGQGDYIMLTLSGSGTPCDGHTWKVPRQSYGRVEVSG
jgi:hypothetical protein